MRWSFGAPAGLYGPWQVLKQVSALRQRGFAGKFVPPDYLDQQAAILSEALVPPPQGWLTDLYNNFHPGRSRHARRTLGLSQMKTIRWDDLFFDCEVVGSEFG